MKVVSDLLLNFVRPVSPGRGSAAGRKMLAPPYYSARAVFASPLSAFFISCVFLNKAFAAACLFMMMIITKLSNYRP